MKIGKGINHLSGDQIGTKTEWMKQTNGGHIFYNFHELNGYLKNAITYIKTALEQGDEVLFIENERLWSSLREKLVLCLSTSQLGKVCYINNFDFYCMNGDFESSTILAYFNKTQDDFTKKNSSFRTWAHVEWGCQEDIDRKISDYERIVDATLSKSGLISVCAYDACRVSPSLEAILKRFHNFLLFDDERMIHSEEYSGF